MQSPDLRPRRWIIDFGVRTLEEAASYEGPFQIVEVLVRPEREALDESGHFRVKRKAYRDRWWRFAERSARLYEQTVGLQRVIGISETSKVMLPVLVPTGGVFYQSAFVIASDDEALFGLLTSSFHWLWAARAGGASSLVDRPRYHQERCFETFARPPTTERLRHASAALQQHRAAMMLERGEGLTELYNRVTDVGDRSADVESLRRLHAQLDGTVGEAYGWTDLDLDLGVHDHPRFGKRWLPRLSAQREIEERLQLLNQGRAEGEKGHA